MKRTNVTILLAILLIFIAASARIFNAQLHLPNIAPLSAIALFSGYAMKEKRALAFLVPLMGQFIADVYFQLFTSIPGFYSLTAQLFNYGALLSVAVLGTSLKQPKVAGTLAAVLGGSTLFYVVSNFGYFAQGWNGYTFSGLVKTYIDAVPFYKFTLLGDLVGGLLLFGGFAATRQSLAKKAVATV